MYSYLTKLFNSNWFFVVLLCFILVLPFSHALVSIFGGVLLLVALIEDKWENKRIRFNNRKVLLFISAIFIVYLISAIVFYKNGDPFYDLKKAMFFLITPLAFVFGKSINDKQRRFLFYAFGLAIFISTIVAIYNWLYFSSGGNFEVHKITIISHIRFSFQIILAIWFFSYLLQKNFHNLDWKYNLGLLVIVLYYFSFLLFQQSLTGLVALIASACFFYFYSVFQLKTKLKWVLIIVGVAIVLSPVLYVISAIQTFYNIEELDRASIDIKSSRGNYYWNDFENPMVENGFYVGLYNCEKEMREEWNNISAIKYDSIQQSGYPINSVLKRYLTSKGLRKDADGILALTPQDIKNVENNIANVIYQERKYSLYPRIYQTIWEYYVYSKTGIPNYQSFSQRIEFSKAAIFIIKNNFWFGVGTGNWKEEFKNAYQINNSKLSEDLYASSHNQYLNYWVKFGIIGFAVILFFILYPVIKTKTYRNPLFLTFLIFMFAANLADSNFESHMGSSFFLFFYCLLITSGDGQFLTIKEQ